MQHSRRYKCRFVVVWNVLLLLQQFELVLLVNVKEMKENKRSERNFGHVKTNIDDHVADVIEAIEKSTNKLRQNDESFNSTISKYIKSCDKAEKVEEVEFWKSQPTVYPIYLMVLMIPLYVLGCLSILKSRIEELLTSVNKTDLIEFIMDISDENFQSYKKDIITDKNKDDVTNLQLVEGADFVSDKIRSINTLSAILNDMNSSTSRLIDGALEGVLDRTIKEYEVISAIINTEYDRSKRSLLVSSSGQMTARASWKDMDIKRTLVKMFADKNKNKLKTEITRYGINPSRQNYMNYAHRTKRLVSSALSVSPIFIKNSDIPCKLLMVKETYDDFVLTFGSYDSENIQNQLWLYENGSIQNYATGLFLNTDTEMQTLKFSRPITKIIIIENSIFPENSSRSCAFNVQLNTTHAYLKLECFTKNQNWSFTTFELARENFMLINCFFFIQSNDSCDVLTQDADSDVVVKSVSTEDVSRQLWYWDGKFIKESTTHRYLSSGMDGSHVRLLQRDEDLNQNWLYDNGYMIANNLYDDIVLSKKPQIIVEAKKDVRYQKWNIVRIKLDNITSCIINKGYFVIKNINAPCQVLCTNTYMATPSLMVQAGAATGFITLGVISGIILYYRYDKSLYALTVGISVGICISALSLVIIHFTSWFKETVVTPKFSYYDDQNPSACTWYTKDNYVLNLKNDWSFHVSNNGLSITISDNNVQKWYFQDNNIFSETKTKCFLIVNPNPDLSVSCSTNVTNQWSLIRHDSSPGFFEKVNCLFFLKSNAPTTKSLSSVASGSCGVLTSIDNETEISIKLPSYADLFNQLWYFRGNKIYNAKSGNYLPPQFQNYIPIEFNMSMQNPDLVSCRSELFFIQNEAVPCMVLGIDNLTGNVELQTYDESRLSSQLWMYTTEMLLHYESDLFLSIQNYLSNSSIVLDMNRYNVSQKWTIKNNYVISQNLNNTCFLSVGINSSIELDCTSFSNKSRLWHLVPYDTNFEYLGDVVCAYFIRSMNEPCELLTGNQTTLAVQVRPASEDLFPTQLWYTLNNEIIHVHTGLSLGVADDIFNALNVRLSESTFPNTHWRFIGNKFESKYKHGNLLTLNTLKGIVMLGKENPNSEFQKWKLLNSKLALENTELLTCRHNQTQKKFFLKSREVGCKLLTATEQGLSPSFEHFDESKLNLQLWYWDFLNVINVQTGLSLEVNVFTSEITLSEHTTYYIQNKQFYIDGDSIVKKTQDNVTCGLIPSYSGKHQTPNQQHITCSTNYFQHKWDLIEYESALNDMSTIVCIYLIRMKEKPCEYITGFARGLNLKVRPLVHELIDNHLFYVNGQAIVHMGTELRITSTANDLILEDKKNGTRQNWIYDKHMFVTDIEESGFWEIDKENDGKVIFASKYKSRKPQQWILQEHASTLNSVYIPEEYCFQDNKVSSLFFLKNSQHPCLLLTTGNLGYPPEFKIFNKENFNNQLWYFHDNHVVNNGSGLAIMMDNIMLDGNFDIKMWHYSSFSSLQMWVIDTYVRREIGNKIHSECFLVPQNSAENLIINSRCTHNRTSKWDFIEMDEEHEYLSKVTCSFYIQTLVSPCELLTGFGYNESVRLRPKDTDNVSQQLWFWDNNYIINYNSRLALTTYSDKNGSFLHLTNKTKISAYQQWKFSYTFIALLNNSKLTIGFSRYNGDVTLYQRSAEMHQEWKLIDRNEGDNNPELLNCYTANSNAVAYIIRSEHGDCPLLAHIGNNIIGLQMPDSGTIESKYWILQDNHIISFDNSKSLSLQVNGRLFLENTFSFEKRQQWKRSGDFIHTLYTKQDRLVTYVSNNHVSVAYPSRNSQQTWKWYTVNEIKDDDKLLRCSRCYNAQEETTSEVMAYIPFLSSIYSAIRSVVYAVKNCPKIAWDTFKSFAKDLAFDAAMTLLVVVTGGAASAVALGIKTGMQAGYKAGMKATFNAMKSMIKLSLKTYRKGLQNTLKQGFTKTLKAKLTTIKSAFKSNIKAVVSLPQRLKAITTNARKFIKESAKDTLKSLTKFITRSKYLRKKKFHKISRIGPKLKDALINLPGYMKDSFKRVVTISKSKMKRLIDKLAEPAESALKTLDNINFPNKLMRCRRMIKEVCSNPIGKHTDDNIIFKASNYKGTLHLENKWSNQFSRLFKDLNLENTAGKRATADVGQRATVGVMQADKFVHKETKHINEIKISKVTPIPKNINNVPKNNNDPTNVMHTEQYLFSRIENNLKNCKVENPCQVFLHTKLSPCTEHKQSYAWSCLEYIISSCKKWFANQGTRCHIGFDTFYDNSKEVFDDKWNNYFASILGSSKYSGKSNMLYNELRSKGLSEKSIGYTNELLNENTQLIREKLATKMENGYAKLKSYIPFKDLDENAFKPAWEQTIAYFNHNKPKTSDLWPVFEQELQIQTNKQFKNAGKSFNTLIDKWSAVASRETLNEIATKRTVMSDIVNMAGGTQTDFLDFSLLD